MTLAISIGDVISVMAVLGIVGLVLRNNHVESGKRKAVYGKIEEVKKDLDEKKVDEKVCTVQHKFVEKSLKDITKKTDCIPEIKVGVDLLLKQNGLKSE